MPSKWSTALSHNLTKRQPVTLTQHKDDLCYLYEFIYLRYFLPPQTSLTPFSRCFLISQIQQRLFSHITSISVYLSTLLSAFTNSFKTFLTLLIYLSIYLPYFLLSQIPQRPFSHYLSLLLCLPYFLPSQIPPTPFSHPSHGSTSSTELLQNEDAFSFAF